MGKEVGKEVGQFLLPFSDDLLPCPGCEEIPASIVPDSTARRSWERDKESGRIIVVTQTTEVQDNKDPLETVLWENRDPYFTSFILCDGFPKEIDWVKLETMRDDEEKLLILSGNNSKAAILKNQREIRRRLELIEKQEDGFVKIKTLPAFINDLLLELVVIAFVFEENSASRLFEIRHGQNHLRDVLPKDELIRFLKLFLPEGDTKARFEITNPQNRYNHASAILHLSLK